MNNKNAYILARKWSRNVLNGDVSVNWIPKSGVSAAAAAALNPQDRLWFVTTVCAVLLAWSCEPFVFVPWHFR